MISNTHTHFGKYSFQSLIILSNYYQFHLPAMLIMFSTSPELTDDTSQLADVPQMLSNLVVEVFLSIASWGCVDMCYVSRWEWQGVVAGV